MELHSSIRVVVIYPDDVRDLRDALMTAIEKDVDKFARRHQIRIDCVDWRNGVEPGFDSSGAQNHIDKQLRIADSDYVVGIFRNCIGRIRPDGLSYTQHEYRQAFEAFKANQQPQMLLFFGVPLVPMTHDDKSQLNMLKSFKREAYEHGVCPTFETEAEFVSQVRDCLLNRVVREAARRHASDSVTPVLAWSACSNSVRVRAEGITELVGDVGITLAGLTDDAVEPQPQVVRIDLYVTTNVTNRCDANSYTAARLLVLDERQATVVSSTRGRRVSDDRIAFENVALSAKTRDARHHLRIINTRANVQELGNYATIYGVIAVHRADKKEQQILSVNNFVVSAESRPSMVMSVVAGEISRASGSNPALLGGEQPASFSGVLRFREGFPGAFRTRQQEGTVDSPIGMQVLAGWSGETADHGTRFLVRFAGVPSSVRLFVSQFNLPGGGRQLPTGAAQLVAADNMGNSSGRHPVRHAESVLVEGQPVVEIANGYAVWEMMNAEPDAEDLRKELQFGVAVVAEPNAASLGTCFVNCTLAPVSTVFTASPTAPIPRFIDMGVGRDRPLFTVVP